MNKSRQILSNSMYLLVRQILVMGITLYTSRVILAALGFVDYGIYTLVGGLAMSFAFFSSSLSNASQRSLSYELGRNNEEALKKVFANSLLIYLLMALVTVGGGLAIGLYFVCNKLDIPAERMEAALYFFYATIASLFVTLVSSLYESVLISRENMRVYALSGLLEALLRLVTALLIASSSADKLKLYAVLFFVSTIVVRSVPVVYCIRTYPESRMTPRLYRGGIREILSLIGWNGLGTATWSINMQGVDVLINIFFGPVYNAAKGISAQVNAAINNFTATIFSAVRPQITKSYAAGDLDYNARLVYASAKFSYFVCWLMSLPILFRGDYVLLLWLGAVPDGTMEILSWSIGFALVNILIQPLWTTIFASGRIGRFICINSLIFISTLPISWGGYKWFDKPVVFALIVMTVVRMACLVNILHYARQRSHITYKSFFSQVLLPIFLVTLFSGGGTLLLNSYLPGNFLGFTLLLAGSLVCTVVSIYILGLGALEKQFLMTKIKS